MTTSYALSGAVDRGLGRYLQEIKQFPLLTSAEEYQLARKWRDGGDREAAQRLVTSHLRLVAKIAMGYRGYGLPIGEVISEGNVGLMQAVRRFEPEQGFRLATYAIWWITAAIQEYVLRSWSLVKLGTTASQKRLFFNLRRAKAKISALEQGDLRPEHVKEIAKQLNVPERDVISMNRRMAGDRSLNVRINADVGEGEWQDFLPDSNGNQEVVLADRQEVAFRRELMREAIATLTPREQTILAGRRLASKPRTLDDLSQEFSVSRERIRQIEMRAFEKVCDHVNKAVRKAPGGGLEAPEAGDAHFSASDPARPNRCSEAVVAGTAP